MAPRRRITFDLDLDIAQAALRSLDPALEVTTAHRIDGGGSEVYQLDAPGRAPLVLKIYPEQPAWRAGKEALVAGWMDGALTLPTPRCLGLDESRSILPHRYAVFTWLPGRSLRDAFGAPDIEEAYRQMGALLRSLHTIPMPGYGYIREAGIADARPTNADYMSYALESLFRRFRSAGGDEALARELERIALGGLDLMAESAGPVLCHDDFHPGNVLAERDASGRLRLTALIDFGNVRAGDAVFDLAKALFCCRHEDPSSAQPLLDGYGPIDHSAPQRVLWLYTLFHRVSMWAWLTGVGADPSADDGPGGLLRDLHEMVRAT